MNINKLYSIFKQHPIVCTDSRKITQGAIFFALKGDNFNGNEFAKKAINEGCAYAIVDQKQYNNHAKTILVEDVLQTLQELAKYHREQLSIPIIGITGSNGKTTSKELISAILSTEKRCYATKGNLNNHIGVPLSVLEINHNHEIAIIEMGANHIGEIATLCKIAQPNLGVITNIGKAHLEGFGDLEGVIQAKTELYNYIKKNNGKIFVNGEDDLLMNLAHKFGFRKGVETLDYDEDDFFKDEGAGDLESVRKVYIKSKAATLKKVKTKINLIKYGQWAPTSIVDVPGSLDELVDVQKSNNEELQKQIDAGGTINKTLLENIDIVNEKIRVQKESVRDSFVSIQPHRWRNLYQPWLPEGYGEIIYSNLIGNYQFSNIMLAITIGEYYHIAYENWKKAIENYTPTNNRSEIIKTKNNTLILDAYNANPSSMRAMLTSFSKQDNKNKLCILGDMLELGKYSEKEHQEITSLCKSLNLNCYFIGEEFQKVNNDAFKNRQDFEEQIQKETIKGKTILLKGSRGIGLEKLVEYL